MKILDIDFKKAKILALKELKVLFGTPTAYFAILFFLIFTNIFFINISGFFTKGDATLSEYFNLMPLVLMVILPSLSMSSFSEETKTGSIELLYSLPINTKEMVLGKFITLKIFTLILFLLSLPLTLMALSMGNFDFGVVFLQYIGIILYSVSTLSLGLFISTLTKSQIVSYLITLFILVLMNFSASIVNFISKNDLVIKLFNMISIKEHFYYFNIGVLNFFDFFYFIGLTFLFLVMTYYQIIFKKWR